MFILNPFIQGIQATGGDITYSAGKVIHTFNTDGVFSVTSGAGDIEVYMWGAGGAGGRPGGWSYGSPGGGGGAAYGKIKVNNTVSYNVAIGGPGNYVTGANPTPYGGGSSCYNGSDPAYGGGGGGFSGLFLGTVSQANAIMIAGGGGGGGSSRAGTLNSGGSGGGSFGEVGGSPYDGKSGYAGNPGTQTAAGADASCQSPNTNGNQGALQGGNSRINSYGGGGGGGYRGGSGGGYSESNTMGGGGGGSGYLKPGTVIDGVLTGGNGSTPGDSSNPYRGTGGNAGAVSAIGSAGKVVIVYTGGVDIYAGAKAELAKISDGALATLPYGTSNTKVGVEAAILVLANAIINPSYTVTIDSGSTYNDGTNAWSGKLVVTDDVIALNTWKDGSNRNLTITIVIDTTSIHTSKTFDSAADLTSDGWATFAWNAGSTIASGLWRGNNTDGGATTYKNFAAGLTDLIITQTLASCSGSNAGWGGSGYFCLYPTQHSGSNGYDPADVIQVNREMYASSAESYNGIPTYHRSVLQRKIAGVWNSSGANRESVGNTTWDAVVVQQLEFHNGNCTYRVRSNGSLITTYTFTTSFTRIYGVTHSVGSSTGSQPQIDTATLWHNT